MARAFIDHTDTLEANERMGVVYSLRKLVHVQGITGTDEGAIIRALDEAGVPATGTPLIPGASSLNFAAADSYKHRLFHLVLTDKEVKLHDKDTGSAQVVLKYEHVLNGPYQRLFAGDQSGMRGDGKVYGIMDTSLTEEETNMCPVWLGDDDIQNAYNNAVTGETGAVPARPAPPVLTEGSRVPVVLKHPSGINMINQQVTYQSGKFKGLFTGKVYTLEGYFQGTVPHVLAESILWRVNSTDFLGGASYTWLCTKFTYKAIGRSILNPGDRYECKIEFQYKDGGWNPTVVYHDAELNRPPADIDNPPNPLSTYSDNQLIYANIPPMNPPQRRWLFHNTRNVMRLPFFKRLNYSGIASSFA